MERYILWWLIFISASMGSEWARHYDNARYGVHISLPPMTFHAPKPYGKSGKIYQGADGRSKLIVIVEPQRASLGEIYRKMRRSLVKHNDIVYERFKDDWFVISATDPEDGTILYQKACKQGALLRLYILIYPQDQKWRFDPVIRELNHNICLHDSQKTRKKKDTRSSYGHLGGRECDAMARACYAECGDGDERCLQRCETRRDSCYKNGKF